MNCPEARKLLHLYLDSELDARSTQDVGRHLEACAECAELFAAEARIERRMIEVLRRGRRNASLWEEVEARIRPPRRFAGWKLRRAIAAGLALALLAGVILWRGSRPLDLAEAVAHCHSAYAQRLTAPEFSGEVPEAIARQLGERLDVAAFSFRPSAPAFRSQGARFCRLDDVPVALILGEVLDKPVSLVVFKRSELKHFPNTRRRLESGEPIVCGRAGRFQFASRLVNDHVVCVVSEMPRRRLEELLRTVNPSG